MNKTMNMTNGHNMHSNVTHMPNNNMTDMHTMHGNMTDMHNNNMTDMHNMHNNDMTDMNHGPGEHGNEHLLHGEEHEMKMYFHTGISEYVLFQDLYTSSNSGMIGACFAIFAVAVLYEGVKFLREELLQRTLTDKAAVYSMKELDRTTGGPCLEVRTRMFSCGHFLQVFLHIFQVFISYCLMLTFMTFNVWLSLAVLLGAGVGHFLFGWKRTVAVDKNEHCH